MKLAVATGHAIRIMQIIQNLHSMTVAMTSFATDLQQRNGHCDDNTYEWIYRGTSALKVEDKNKNGVASY